MKCSQIEQLSIRLQNQDTSHREISQYYSKEKILASLTPFQTRIGSKAPFQYHLGKVDKEQWKHKDTIIIIISVTLRVTTPDTTSPRMVTTKLTQMRIIWLSHHTIIGVIPSRVMISCRRIIRSMLVISRCVSYSLLY